MTNADIITAISTVGYPIASSLILMWYIYHQTKAHKDEADKMAEAIKNNTLALQQLADQMGGASSSGHHAA